MNIIVNADKNWAIGKNNSLLVRIPADMKYFRQMTEGNIVVMGRKTLESFPQGRPLANRVNIVISHNPDYQVKDAIVVHSVEEAMQECKKHEGEVFVIGGESITVLCFRTVIQRMLRGQIMYMRQIPGSRIWTRIRIGKKQLRRMNRHISILSMYLQNMKE